MIAGGGTGGHVIPGLAIAGALVDRGVAAADIHWIGSRRGMEVEAVPAAGFELTVLSGRGLERRFALENVRNSLEIVRAVVVAIGLLRRLRPSVVVALGGYAAVPASVAAVLNRVPIVIQEQNARASLANRLVSRFATASAVLVAGTGLRNEIVTGNPLREEIRAAVDMTGAEAKSALGMDLDRIVIAAFGGSLGSLRINNATLDLAHAWRDRADLTIHHVIGSRDWPETQGRIRALSGARLDYRAVEYEHDMGTVLAAADVAICRAGGMTVSELAVLGVPAVLVPLPIAPNDAQRFNANALAEVGAGLVVSDAELDCARLEVELSDLFESGLASRAQAARSFGRFDAADRIAALILEARDA